MQMVTRLLSKGYGLLDVLMERLEHEMDQEYFFPWDSCAKFLKHTERISYFREWSMDKARRDRCFEPEVQTTASKSTHWLCNPEGRGFNEKDESRFEAMVLFLVCPNLRLFPWKSIQDSMKYPKVLPLSTCEGIHLIYWCGWIMEEPYAFDCRLGWVVRGRVPTTIAKQSFHRKEDAGFHRSWKDQNETTLQDKPVVRWCSELEGKGLVATLASYSQGVIKDPVSEMLGSKRRGINPNANVLQCKCRTITYLRHMERDGEITTSLVMARTRLVPRKPISAAKLALNVALQGARLAET
ncbi:hypothetical protein TCAL_10795 [Tigriopus californicus]|uniref:Uncharacterized protein n=1 Tax=Tigriopus californicus TaxID=6832 RepID=A0A553PPZ0_TIGCA|nr:hypothetical protein TCAL_10795 [Tigriopus californicus]|eukprot:TCALIF_10795-PA protein Name:"Protein of unknown function" AED:0.35 eAED:0.74 QI:0/0/0/0.33/1/1/3/0/296